MFGDLVSSASHGDVFLGVSVLRLISQIPNNSPIPITVFLGLFAVVGSWQDSYEKEGFTSGLSINIVRHTRPRILIEWDFH